MNALLQASFGRSSTLTARAARPAQLDRCSSPAACSGQSTASSCRRPLSSSPARSQAACQRPDSASPLQPLAGSRSSSSYGVRRSHIARAHEGRSDGDAGATVCDLGSTTLYAIISLSGAYRCLLQSWRTWLSSAAARQDTQQRYTRRVPTSSQWSLKVRQVPPWRSLRCWRMVELSLSHRLLMLTQDCAWRMT